MTWSGVGVEGVELKLQEVGQKYRELKEVLWPEGIEKWVVRATANQRWAVAGQAPIAAEMEKEKEEFAAEVVALL
jgi:hypothetical protein